MAATVQILEKNGAGPTTTDKTSSTIRFKNADNATVDLNNPMVKPAAGIDYSYEKWVRFNVSGGSYTQITDIVAYTDGHGSDWPGCNLFWGKRDVYQVPAEPVALESGFFDAFDFTSGAPFTLDAGPFTGTGEKGKHLVMVLQVFPTAVAGLLAGETLTIAWDEI